MNYNSQEIITRAGNKGIMTNLNRIIVNHDSTLNK